MSTTAQMPAAPALALVQPQPVLSRRMLANGGAVALVTQNDPDARIRTAEDRSASLAAFMDTRPDGDVWVFAYGSLIWNPAIETAERRLATVEGWHRTFCLSMSAGRGTAARPGLALGLDGGGACQGVAYRLSENDVTAELSLLWGREMLLGGYNPEWVELIGEDGAPFGHGVSFVIDASHQHYAGEISLRTTIERLATAAGSWGSASDYLFRTIEGLRAQRIHDDELERVGALVEAATLLSFWQEAA